MYDRVLVITTNSYYSKVPSTGTAELFLVPYRYRGTILAKYRVPVPRYLCPPMTIGTVNMYYLIIYNITS